MKDFKLSNFLDVLSNYLFKYLDKLNGFSKKPKGEKIIKGIVKIGLLLILLLLVKGIFMAASSLGTGLIYLFGTTLRGALSGVWEYAVSYSYYALVLITLYRVVLEMSKDKNYIVNVKINKKQRNVYNLAAGILKLFIVFLCVPILATIFMCCALIGMLLALLHHGIFIFSLFLMIISIIIILGSCLFIIAESVLVKGEVKNA